MNKKTITAIIMLTCVCTVFGAAKRQRIYPPLRDGFVFIGVNGQVKSGKSPDQFIFIPDTSITDGRGVLMADAQAELLPCSTLEKISAAMNGKKSLGVRLSARVTLYEKKNYLYPILFLPTTGGDEPEDIDNEKNPETWMSDPNEPSIIPEHIRKLLSPKRVVNLGMLKDQIETENDAVLVNRTGYVSGKKAQEKFSIDCVGRNIEDISFKLLKNMILQQTEEELALTPNRHRYRTSGIVTKYKGQYYLLLQRAVRTYTHGNFAR